MAVAAGLTVALGGCGTDAGHSSGGHHHRSGGSPAGSGSASGRTVFAEHCAICHSISGHPAPTQQGGDLGSLHFPRRQLVELTVEMPVIRRPLRSAEVQAVVSYMQSLARRR